jgi:signal transduction histidine kinase
LTASTSREELARRWNDCARLASRIAHDFDNVLTGVNGFVELALGDSAVNPGARQQMHGILRATERGAEFTSRLHLLQRCGISRPERTAVAPVVSRLAQTMRKSIPAGVSLRVHSGADCHVRMEEEPLLSALNQLATNAVEACGERGTVNLEVALVRLDAEAAARLFGNAEPGSFAEIRIADSGPGIAPEVRAQLLIEPLFTTKFQHRGLGLAIAFRALSAHAGGFCLEPGAVHGTVARVFVPVA